MRDSLTGNSIRSWHRGTIRLSLSTGILWGLLAGIVAGLLFGEYCARLAIVGDAFVGLLRMTVLPYIMASLIANFGRLSLRQSRRLALVGGVVLLLLWVIGLFSVFALANTFPVWKGGSFYSTSVTDAPGEIDLISLFIPANVFNSLSENHVPAVVLLCICVGIGLSGMATAIW